MTDINTLAKAITERENAAGRPIADAEALAVAKIMLVDDSEPDKNYALFLVRSGYAAGRDDTIELLADIFDLAAENSDDPWKRKIGGVIRALKGGAQ